MERFEVLFTKMAFILLAAWVVLAGLGMTTMPGTKKEKIARAARRRGYGSVWATPVVAAPNAESDLAFPPAMVM